MNKKLLCLNIICIISGISLSYAAMADNPMMNNENERSARNGCFRITIDANGAVALTYRDGGPMAQITMNGPAGTTFESDGEPELRSVFGAGKRFVWNVNLQENLTGEFWLSSYDVHSFILIGGQIKVTGSESVYVDNVCPFELGITREDIKASRLFINSGCQGFSGSISLDDPFALSEKGYECSTMCAYQDSDREDCIGIGSVSIRRAEVLLERQLEGQTLKIRPWIQYDKVRLDPGESLRLETLVVNTSPHGGTLCLEQWADIAAEIIRPQFHRSMAGLYNTWYAYHSAKSDHGTEELILNSVEELKRSGLDKYGINVTTCGVWHNRGAFSEHETWPNLMPHGYSWVAQSVNKQGFQMVHGGFWGKVSECATIFKEHSDWMVKDANDNPRIIYKTSWNACNYPCYDLDLSNPQAFEWLKQESMAKHVEVDGKIYILDFFGVRSRRTEGAVAKDEKMVLPTEMERKHLKALRDILGEGGYIEVYTSPTNRLAGLVDRVRMAADCGVLDPSPHLPHVEAREAAVTDPKVTANRWNHIKEVVRNMAAAYFYHDKLWMNNPDPIMVGRIDRPETLEEARVRMMIAANSGGYPTIGEALDHMAPARLALLKKALPVYGKAAKPVDLMEQTYPSIYHLHVEHPGESWDTITIFNWDDQPRQFTVDLDDIGLANTYHAFEFWTQDYLGVVGHALNHTVPGRACRVLRLTTQTDRPQLVGTDRHIFMGVTELPAIRWDHKRNVLSGVALRPMPEEGLVTIALPKLWQAQSTENIKLEPDGVVLKGRLKFECEGQAWTITFAKIE